MIIQDQPDRIHWWAKSELHICWIHKYPGGWTGTWIWPCCGLLLYSPVHRAVEELMHAKWCRDQCCWLLTSTRKAWNRMHCVCVDQVFHPEPVFISSVLLRRHSKSQYFLSVLFPIIVLFSELRVQSLWCVKFYGKIWEKRDTEGPVGMSIEGTSYWIMQ